MHRDFDAERAERARAAEPITLKLADRVWTLRNGVPFGNVVAIALANKNQDEMAAISASRDLIVSAVVDDQVADFTEVVDRLDTDTVLDLTRWIVEASSARPTPPPSDSPGGRESNGEGSTSVPAGTASGV